jgi:hypothetical protein
MKAAGVPYSGKFDWIETEMHWPLTHLVVSKENAFHVMTATQETEGYRPPACWIPGRDRSLFFDIFGILLIAGLLQGLFYTVP